jgi:hypothetical protein
MVQEYWGYTMNLNAPSQTTFLAWTNLLIRGLMTDDEWAYFEPFLIHRGGGRLLRNHRRVLDAFFWLMRTGAPFALTRS